MSILRIFSITNFLRTFLSFCSFQIFSWDSLGRCDLFGPKIVKIRAILAIFRPFEDFRFSRRALSATCINYWELWLKMIFPFSDLFPRFFLTALKNWQRMKKNWRNLLEKIRFYLLETLLLLGLVWIGKKLLLGFWIKILI